jgi:NitT/TauT family transport system ATP-binding protein/nitrate/nitrite transport system substrate-binding protein
MLSPEQTKLTLGFIPLTDSAPLIVAKEMGFFSQWGLQVVLQKQNSWATLRDKLQVGLLDGAQMLAPMPIACSLGLGCKATRVITPLVLSLNGNAITLSESLHQEVLRENDFSQVTLPLASYVLQKVISQRQQQGRPKLIFATVFPYSCHYYQLRDWLASSHIDEKSVDIIVVPPANMVAYLQSGEIDGCCVGGPWNAKAVRAGIGLTALTSFDIWQDSPEKVLGLLESWQQQHPNTVLALTAALKQACVWLESIPNRFEAARLLSAYQYLDASVEVIAPSLIGSCLTHVNLAPRAIPSYNQFSQSNHGSINIPEYIRGEWLLRQMANAGQLKGITLSANLIKEIFRPDIYHQMRLALEAQAVGANRP